MRWQRHVDDGRRYVSQGDYAQAEQSLLAAVKEALSLGPADLRVASSLGILGKLKHKQGDRDRARAFLERALAVREEALGPEHYGVVQGLNDLASLHYSHGQLAEARELFERALAIAERQLAPDHADLALALYNLSRVYFKSGDHLRAEPLLVRLLAHKECSLGEEHADVAAILTALARVRSMAGRHEDAERMARRALAIREKVLPPDDPAIAIGLDLVAYFCAGRAKRMRSLADAERILASGSSLVHGDGAGSDSDDIVLNSSLQALAEEERALRERARSIRSQSKESTEPSTLERTPEPVSREPVSREPVSREPVSREPVSREPVPREPEVVQRPHGGVVPLGVPQPSPLASAARFATSSSLVVPLRNLARGPRGRMLAAAALFALVASGGIGFAMGRGARTPAAASVTALEDGSPGVVVQPQAGSLQSSAASNPVVHPSAKPPPPATAKGSASAPQRRGARSATPRAARIPTRRQAQRMTRTMERLGTKVMSGVEVRVDSIGRSLELPPPEFGQP